MKNKFIGRGSLMNFSSGMDKKKTRFASSIDSIGSDKESSLNDRRKSRFGMDKMSLTASQLKEMATIQQDNS